MINNIEFKRYKVENDIRSFMNQNIWRRIERLGCEKFAANIITRKEYGGRQVHGDSWTNKYIADMIQSKSSFMVARFGSIELDFLIKYQIDKIECNSKSKSQLLNSMDRLCLNAGFFPKDLNLAGRFANTYFESIAEMDLCGVWNLYMEDYILDRYAPECLLTGLRFLEPWNTKGEIAWSSCLAGKKVLVIHPFTDTIERQYFKHKEIFSNKFVYENILPDFELKTIKAVQSIGGESDQFDDWFDALDDMIKQIKQTEFDVAIIGCGAYGMPLAAAIKRMGKKAIHLGGATQLMFGIWGHRWDQIPGAKDLLNDSWTRPSDDEKPRRANEIEDGCYW